MGFMPNAHQRAEGERNLSAARQVLGTETFAAAWAAGRALSLDEAVTEALTVEIVHDALTVRSRDDTCVGSMGGRTVQAGFGLSPRELEVLRLLSAGRSDREIGETLFISHRTVMRHVATILAKLGVENRTAAANYSLRHGLA
jgi:DNA-binding NarL/FixJ family response regulator